MPPFRLQHLFTFLVGIALAFAVARGGFLKVKSKDVRSSALVQSSKTSENDPLNDVRRARLDGTERDLSSTLPSQASMSVADLIRALQRGTVETLQAIRLEHLRTRDDYEGTVLPALKKEGILTLAGRYSESDWRDWPRASYNDGGKPTPARRFLNDVITVNPELGNFLETAALLMHRAYFVTSRGERYVVDKDAPYVFANAEQMFAHRKRLGVATRTIVATEIVHDSSFHEGFGLVLSDLVSRYVQRNPKHVAENLEYLLSVDPPNASPEYLEVLANILRRIAIEGTPKLRERIIVGKGKLETLQPFAVRDRKVRRALAELLVVAALDALESGEHDRSVSLLKESASIQPGLRSQMLVGGYLSQLRERSTQVRKQISQFESSDEENDKLFGKTEPKSERELEKHNTSEAPSKEGGWSWLRILAYVIPAIILIGGGITAWLALSQKFAGSDIRFSTFGSSIRKPEFDQSEPFSLDDFSNSPLDEESGSSIKS